MSKTPKYVKSAVDNYRNKFDIVQARLDKGTSARIEALGLQKSDFINSLVSSELNKLEKGEKPKKKPKEPTPKEVNGKPVYRFWEEDEYIKRGGQWWHEVVFFHDDMELNDLFIKFLDKEADENEGFKNGCRLCYDLIDLARTGSKYGDDELFKMTEEEIDRIPESDLCFDQSAELKNVLKDFVYNGNREKLDEFVGFSSLAEMTKDNR